jgi:hypothetical protein
VTEGEKVELKGKLKTEKPRQFIGQPPELMAAQGLAGVLRASNLRNTNEIRVIYVYPVTG